MIKVTQTQSTDPMTFAVTVADDENQCHYQVTLSNETFRELSGDIDAEPAQCIEAAFRFLLDREPKEAILPGFDITLISSYFPDFNTAFIDYLNDITG